MPLPNRAVLTWPTAAWCSSPARTAVAAVRVRCSRVRLRSLTRPPAADNWCDGVSLTDPVRNGEDVPRFDLRQTTAPLSAPWAERRRSAAIAQAPVSSRCGVVPARRRYGPAPCLPYASASVTDLRDLNISDNAGGRRSTGWPHRGLSRR